MFKKFLSLVLAVLLTNLCVTARVHAATKDKRDGDALSLKKEAIERLERFGIQLYTVRGDMEKNFEGTLKKVAEIGTGRKELVAVNLREQGKNVGYISEIAEDHFMLTDSKTGTTIKLDYTEVKGIRRSHLTSDNMKVLGIMSAGLLGALLVAVVVAASRE